MGYKSSLGGYCHRPLNRLLGSGGEQIERTESEPNAPEGTVNKLSAPSGARVREHSAIPVMKERLAGDAVIGESSHLSSADRGF